MWSKKGNMAINRRTFAVKSVKELSVFLGYSNLVKSPYDVAYWAKNFDLMSNLSDPWENYQFVGEDGQIVERSLAQLCLFQESTFNEGKQECAAIIRDLVADNIISTVPFTSSPSIEGVIHRNANMVPPSMRFFDSRFDNPRAWFDYPQSTDVYTPSRSLPRGVPYAKVNSYVAYSPTPKLFDNLAISDEALQTYFNRFKSAFNNLCLGSNIHPSLFVLFYEVNSPPNVSVDYQQMDRISASIISSRRLNAGVVGARMGMYYDFGPRSLWAQTFDGNLNDNANIAADLSDLTRIDLETNTFSFFCVQANVLNIPSPSNSNGIIEFNSPSSNSGQLIIQSLRARGPQCRISQGIKFYASAIHNFMEYVNLASMVANHPPQVFLHSGMSFYNAMMRMAFRQVGSSMDMLSNYEHLWETEVRARDAGTPGNFGTSVALQSDITPENIGTMALYASRAAPEPVGVVIRAASAVLRAMESPQYGEILARAAHLEDIRQDGQHTLNSTIYRGFSPQKCLLLQAVKRYSDV